LDTLRFTFSEVEFAINVRIPWIPTPPVLDKSVFASLMRDIVDNPFRILAVRCGIDLFEDDRHAAIRREQLELITSTLADRIWEIKIDFWAGVMRAWRKIRANILENVQELQNMMMRVPALPVLMYRPRMTWNVPVFGGCVSIVLLLLDAPIAPHKLTPSVAILAL
jgi:hypothetical protein